MWVAATNWSTMKPISEEINFSIIDVFSTFGWATQSFVTNDRHLLSAANPCRTTSYNSRRLNCTTEKPEISRVFIKCFSYWMVCKSRIIKSYLFPPQSVLTLAAYRQATRNSYREWRYHMLLVYNYVLLKMSTWCSKHVEESNILRINNSW